MGGLRSRNAESDLPRLIGIVTGHHDRVVEIQRFAETLPGGFPVEASRRSVAGAVMSAVEAE